VEVPDGGDGGSAPLCDVGPVVQVREVCTVSGVALRGAQLGVQQRHDGRHSGVPELPKRRRSQELPQVGHAHDARLDVAGVGVVVEGDGGALGRVFAVEI
jgi:hypothetical protein